MFIWESQAIDQESFDLPKRNTQKENDAGADLFYPPFSAHIPGLPVVSHL
jgi:hypothetical protein